MSIPSNDKAPPGGDKADCSSLIADRFTGARVTVMGLGTRGGGVGVARYLAEQGAVVTVTDMKPEEALAGPMAELAGLPIRFVLGRHDDRDFTPEGADIVVRNPGVRRSARLLQLARETGVAIEMEMSIFFRACPAPVIGITGTKGKTSTAFLCAAMLSAWDQRTVLAGNMGISALAALPRIAPDTPVVIELSSWQLEALAEHRLAPAIAVLTNISQDHLDAYDSFDDYAATKRSITSAQSATDTFIVNADDPETWRAASETAARVIPFGQDDRGTDGVWFEAENGALVARLGETPVVVSIPANPTLAGPHQGLNIAAAVAAALSRGAPAAAIEQGLASFQGVRDRMEVVAEIDGVTYVNDTTATAPAAVVAALTRYADRPVRLIAGGADKRTDLAPMVEAARVHADVVYLLQGSATPTLAGLLEGAGVPLVGPFETMQDAVQAATAHAAAGDVVLLSPGCASFGLFQDEFHRGACFREAVAAAALPARDATQGVRAQ
ncbi:MAG TPA: UDP-N-acetylmuramoyl-L-alanine--D-glutamate ligase [Thermomicrobiales bacterium]|nr:UDP-N-acetylmuramoyl-L-alanine--D-glutamate ligase [Thermomicrobiales bacterium]